MDNPLDLKLFLNDPSPSKLFKCDTCKQSFTDRNQFDLHVENHERESASSAIQIIMNPVQQNLPQPAPAHQQLIHVAQQQHQPQQVHVLQEDPQLAAYKRAYVTETGQVYTLSPGAQYQIMQPNGRPPSVTTQNTLTVPTYSSAYVYNSAPVSADMQLQSPEIHTHQSHVDLGQHQVIEPLPQQRQPHLQALTSQPVGAVDTSDPKNRPYKCDKCTASFIDSSELAEHKRKHTDDGPFTCDDCHFTFMFKSHFRSHKTRCQKKRAMNPNQPKPFITTNQIKREFPVNEILESVPQKPKITKPISGNCKQVPNNNAFNPKNPTFKRQKRHHHNDRPFECSDCDASFRTAEELDAHKAKHTGEGPFTCEECNFVFLYRKLHEAHRRRCEKKRRATQKNNPIVDIGETVSTQAQSNTVLYTTAPQTHIIPQHILQDHESLQGSKVVQAIPLSISGNTLTLPVHIQSVPNQQPAPVIDMTTGHQAAQDQHQVQVHSVQQLQHLHLSQNPGTFDQVIQIVTNPDGTTSRGGEAKYDFVIASPVEMDNVGQIVNIIKPKT